MPFLQVVCQPLKCGNEQNDSDYLEVKSVFTQLIDQIWDQFGECQVWVNNAGVGLLTGEGPSLSFDKKLEWLLAVDVTATVHLSREVGRRMKQARQGFDLPPHANAIPTGPHGHPTPLEQ
jgi:NAD(P)-dependent dehydrogenase (short-subunit alcohol dehydrogenase family)